MSASAVPGCIVKGYRNLAYLKISVFGFEGFGKYEYIKNIYFMYF